MGIITQLREMLARRREEPKSDIQEDIDNFRRRERQQMKVDFIMAHEKHSFLYGEEKHET